jgi:hypothetical protein
MSKERKREKFHETTTTGKRKRPTKQRVTKRKQKEKSERIRR